MVEQATLTFREQADGRKVARLPTGKVVLVELDSVHRVADGERWTVELNHHDMFAIATPIEKVGQSPLVLAPPPPPAAPANRPHARNPTTVVMPGAPAALPLRFPEAAAKPVPAPMRPAPRANPVAEVVAATDRVALFVDGANMDGAGRDAGYFLDYGRAREHFASRASAYASFYYVADFTSKDPFQVRFLDFLSHHGYIVRKKAVKVLRDAETGEERYKANVDTEIVVDMLNTADNYDVAFLFSGDSDFERLVDVLRSRGKRIYVVSSKASLSRELAYVADKPVFYLEDLRAELERKEAPGADPTAATIGTVATVRVVTDGR